MRTLEEETISLLYRNDIRVKKYLGQNFLTDERIVEKIIEVANISKEDYVLEIGAGPGIITQKIADRAKKVFALELDHAFIKILQKKLATYKNIDIIKGDILKTDAGALFPKDVRIKVVANLPYYITTPAIIHLLNQKFPPLTELIIMVQREVGERIASLPGSKSYGIFSTAVQYFAKAKIVLMVGKKSFYPVPKVDSSVVKLTILDKPPVKVKDELMFFRIIKASFSHRRKTIANSLLNSQLGLSKPDILNLLADSRIDPKKRAEELSMQDFARMADHFDKIKK